MLETLLIFVVAWFIIGYFVTCILVKVDEIDPATDKHAGMLFVLWALWPFPAIYMIACSVNFANFFFGWINGKKEETAED